MSLISDALKAAQQAKQARSGTDTDQARRVLSRSEGGARFKSVSLGSDRAPLPRPVRIAGLVFALAVAGAGVVMYLAPKPDAVQLAEDDIRIPPAEPDSRPAPEAEETAAPDALAADTGAAAAEGTRADAVDAPEEEARPAAERPAPAVVARREPPSQGGRPRSTPAPRPVASPSGAAQGAAPGVVEPARTEVVAQSEPAQTPVRSAAPAGPPRNTRMQVAVQEQRGVSQLFSDAVAAHRRRDFQSAVELYRRALTVDPNNPELYNNLGTTYQALGELSRARDSFQRALAINSRYAAAWSNLGIVLTALNDETGAQAALSEALRLDPANVAAKVNLANLHQANGRVQQARTLLDEVVRAEPSRAEAQYSLARLLEELGERAAAARHYRLFLAHAGGRFPDLEPRVRQHVAQLEAGSNGS